MEPEEPLVLPSGVIGAFHPVTESDIDWFNAVLSDEIDSWFGSSIRCCDGCVEDFRSRFPATAFRNRAFQNGAMMVELVVTGSRIPGFCTPAQMSTYVHFVRCPRCGDYVRSLIWIHEHAAADDVEDEIAGLIALAQRTPFLILEDAFARRVLDEIRRVSALTLPGPLPASLYRARAAAQVGAMPGTTEIAQFGAPPAEFVAEGRFNHAGKPMLYLADSMATTVAEIGSPGQEFYIATLRFSGDYRILDLIIEEPDEDEWAVLGAMSASALLSAPRTGGGWVRKEYIFTRFVADCAIAAGFDGIRYGSTRHDTGANYVLLDPPSDLASLAAIEDLQSVIAG